MVGRVIFMLRKIKGNYNAKARPLGRALHLNT
jgi:hypothetical protein